MGAWNKDGKGENIWDHLCHTTPQVLSHGDNGDVACDSYDLWKRDVQMAQELGVNHYRLSISWARILPTGFTNEINQKGVTYYSNLIKALKRSGIEPMVTLYHWDLPQSLQIIGGWANDVIVDIFGDYAKLCFELFGEDVKYWITMNEPFQVCHLGYGDGPLAPLVLSPGIGEYLCAHNLIKAHAKAWHIYHDLYRRTQQGVISIVVHCTWFEPESNTTSDKEAAERETQFTVGWYVHPIYNGDYPKVMKDRIAFRSKLEGFPKSRLPEFTSEEIKYINGTHDFLGMNYYTAAISKAIPEQPIGKPSWQKDCRTESYLSPKWESTGVSYMKDTPWGFRKVLKWLKDEYHNPDIYITENGYARDSLKDVSRIRFIREHLSNVRDAMIKDQVNISLYTYWSMMDNFEWNSGYKTRFGLYYTNYSTPQKTRTPRESAAYFHQVIKTHSIV